MYVERERNICLLPVSLISIGIRVGVDQVAMLPLMYRVGADQTLIRRLSVPGGPVAQLLSESYSASMRLAS